MSDEKEAADATVLSVSWQEKAEKLGSSGTAFADVLRALIDTYRGSDHSARGAALALCIEALVEDPDGLSHPLADVVGDVIRRVKLDAFMDPREVIGAVARVVRKCVKRKDWTEALRLALKRACSSSCVAEVTRRGLQETLDSGSAESVMIQALKQARRFLC